MEAEGAVVDKTWGQCLLLNHDEKADGICC
jgi:hypothetical protein